ncbi:ribosomal protein S12 methylthiotransferase accessory factor [Nakamurella sp. UYEF19]|uniref:TOMM precursor leader peptide-binding protein n=1 Tax=Nakamurella sp. UYEF19 TaxID=1756392 RepID=UPI003393916C
MDDRRPAPFLGFKRHIRAEVVPGDATYLISDAGVTALHGDHVAEVVPLLDGTRDLADVLATLGPRMPAEQLGRVLGELMKAGLVRYHTDPSGQSLLDDDPAAADRALAAEAYWDLAGLDGSAALARQAVARVDIVCLGSTSGIALARVLAEDGIEAIEHPAGAWPLVESAEDAAAQSFPDGSERRNRLVVVLTDDYLRPELALLDRSFAAAGRSWVVAKICGATPTFGPFFTAGIGACWSCLSWRLRANRATELPVRRALRQDGPVRAPAAHTGVTQGLAAHLVALAVSAWLAGAGGAEQRIQAFDSVTGGVVTHPVHPRPQCPTCGDPGLIARRTATPLTIRSVTKAWSSGNGHRSASPAQVLAAYGHLVDQLTGVVRELHREERVGEGMHCYTAQRNPAARSRDAADLRSGLRALCGGKGATDLDAKVSALCESLERYSGQLQGDELRVRASFVDLAESAIHPNDVLLFDERQFGSTDASTPLFEQVDDQFDERAQVDWTPVWSLSRHRHRYLPTSMLYFDGSPECDLEPPAGARMATADSNGNAAGSCLEDAIVQGFLELVERDAVALWWYNRTRAAAVDLDSCGDDWVRGQVLTHREANREMWVLDLTSDLGVPVMVALSRRIDDQRQDIVFGFGAHFDPQVAVRRAVAELAQMLPGVLRRASGDLLFRVADPEADRWYRYATVENQAYLLPDPALGVRRLPDFQYEPRSDLAQDIQAIVTLTDRHGLEVLVLDQTRPDIGLPVVKVLVPGLRPFWSRFAPGRLFDVPVLLGRLREPTAYADLNPIPIFI